jgi:hypothetical protein
MVRYRTVPRIPRTRPRLSDRCPRGLSGASFTSTSEMYKGKPLKSRLTAWLVAVAALLVMAPVFPAVAQASIMSLVRSSGSVPILPHGSRAVGALPGDTMISVDVVLRPCDTVAVDVLPRRYPHPVHPPSVNIWRRASSQPCSARRRPRSRPCDRGCRARA